jgi:Recombinase
MVTARQRSARTTGSARANASAATLAPIIKELQAAGITSLNGIAAALDERGVPTPRGSAHWYAGQVSRLLKRLAGRSADGSPNSS